MYNYIIMKNYFIFLFTFFCINVFSQGVAINTDGSNPDATSILDVKSTSKGILIPRMTQSERNSISSPTTSLMIYQTDNTPGFYYYNGTSWVKWSTITESTYTPGTGISISSNTITNTSPDQTVTLTGGGATSVSGTYPNFTISSTDNNSGGSVTSVGLSLPSIITVSNSPVTTSGTLTGTLANQSANTVFAGPTTGAAGVPTFRTLVSADLPSGSGSYIQNGTTSQTADFNITGNGTIGTALSVGTNGTFTGDVNVNGSDINGPGINGGTSGILRINSNTDVRIALDADNNGSQSFDVAPNGGSTAVFSVTEAGNVSADGYIRMKESGTSPTLYTTIQSGDLTTTGPTFTLPTTTGTNGQLMQTNGSGVLSFVTVGSYIPNGVQVFTTAGTFTYTPTAGTKSILVKLWGAGGGGGQASYSNCAGLNQSGGGGGGGGYCEGFISSIAASYSYTVGAGGSGTYSGSGCPTGATAGTATSFGGVFTANGGNGGTAGNSSAQAGGTGGTATGGYLNFTGLTGGTSSSTAGGSGGGYWWNLVNWGGPAGTTTSNATGNNGITYFWGCGGSGCTSRGTGSCSGGAGAQGRIEVYEFK
jgi:hypothetical protein